MDRRQFLIYSALMGGATMIPTILVGGKNEKYSFSKNIEENSDEYNADIVIIGGGMGGCATALAACRNGLKVIMTEETKWIGGQVSQQGVPPDEHQWIETQGASLNYRIYRNRIRDYYRNNYPLTEDAKSKTNLNPGDGSVSKICHEPIVSVQVLIGMLMPYISCGKLVILLNTKAKKAETIGNNVIAITVENLILNRKIVLTGSYFVDATELGDLLPLTKTEYISGAEAKADTKELHALEKADPTNNQAFTICYAMDYVPGANLVIDKPKDYEFWKSYIPTLTPAWAPGHLLSLNYSAPNEPTVKATAHFDPERETKGFNLWKYRKIINRKNFIPGTYQSDITVVNWPQNDYMLGNIIDVSEEEFNRHVNAAKQLSLSLFYWLQTEVPREDGKQGWPGLRLRSDLMGSEDGMALYPYIRESRRIKAMFTILEEHVGKENRKLVSGDDKACQFPDSVGIGYYHLDLHPSCRNNNYIDVDSLPFQIPLGALIPQRVNNLLPACKDIGTTHMTNGCYRLHPVEWGIGEAVGYLVAFAKMKKVLPRTIYENRNLTVEFQNFIQKQGIEIRWNL